MSINSLLRWFLTLLIIVIACVFCYIRYNAYFRNPWTRDGMVQAEVVQVAARVSGEVKTVHVRDNQFVKVGDPLFDLDDRPSRVALSQAEANVRQKQAVAKAARDRAGAMHGFSRTRRVRFLPKPFSRPRISSCLPKLTWRLRKPNWIRLA